MTEVPLRLTVTMGGPDPDVRGPGRQLDLPADGDTMLAAVPPGNTYAVRFATAAGWGGWETLGGESGDAPDEPAAGAAAAPGAAADPRAEGPTPSKVALGPVRVPEGAQRVEVVRLSGTGDELTVTFLADTPGGPDVAAAGTGAAVDNGTGAVVRGLQVAAGSTQMPTIMPRSAWATEGWATANAGCQGGPEYSDRIQAAVVHHTVTANNYSADQVDDMIRAVYYAHVRINGWCDVGYNFLVDRFGTIWQGRSGDADRAVIGGHTKGFNSSTVGIALLGQHQPGASPAVARPSGATSAAVAQLAAWKLSLYGVDPNGVTWLKNRSDDGPQKLTSNHWHLVRTVMGHRDLGLTSCPGDYGYELMGALPATLTTTRPADEPPVFASYTPYDRGSGAVTVNRRGGVRAAGSVALPGAGEAPESPGLEPLPSPPPVAVSAAGSGGGTRGWILHADGVVQPYGGATPVAGLPAAGETPVDVVAGTTGGWVISAQAGVHGFAGAGDKVVGGTTGQPIMRGDLTASGDGYLLESTGRLRPVGAAPERQLPSSVSAVDVAVRLSADSGWVLSTDGRLHAFGGAPPASITAPGRPAAGRVYRAVVASPSGRGGWVVTDDGQLWPFGGERLMLPTSTDTARADTVDAAVAGVSLPPGWLASADARWLTKASRLFLGRDPAAGELDWWDARLTYAGATRRVLADELARSDEWVRARVDELYTDVLGRPADPAGRTYWVGRIRAGLSLQQLGVNFYGSAEYVAGSGSTDGYVRRLYQAILHREADPGGLAYWAGRLTGAGARPPDVANGFYQSVESRTDRVGDLYQIVLGRGADPAGLAFWVDQLLRSDDVALAADLASSDEFLLRG